MSGAAIVIGGSAGALVALEAILAGLPANFAPPILVVEHLHASDDGAFARHLALTSTLPVCEPCDKTAIKGGCIYVAPANYHMLVEQNATISLSVSEKVNWSRPSIDVLFESAAHVWRGGLIAVILSGASTDGAQGLLAVKAAGGHVFAQDPASAETPLMPQAAINAGAVDEVLTPAQIARRLIELGD